jgi:hypothetical protein
MLALLSAAVLAGGGPAEAALHGVRPAVTAGVISTVAGGVGGPAAATTAALNYPGPCGVSYAAGQIYVADGYAVRDVNSQTDGLTTPAGTGLDGPLSIGGLAANSAGLGTCGVAVDRAGNLVIAVPMPDHVLVAAQATGSFYGQAMKAGHIYNVAGNGSPGFSGDGGKATAAKINSPAGVAVDAAGNLLIADYGNNRIRVVVAASSGTYYGQAMTAGHIYSVAGKGKAGFSGDGGPATSAKIDGPNAVTVDGAGNLLISDTDNDRVRVVAASSGTYYGQAMTAGDIGTYERSRTPGSSRRLVIEHTAQL